MGRAAVGELFADRFRIESELGQGGFGTVYGAVDVVSGETVALKVLDTDDATAQARFEREVAIVASLTSPHTVRVRGSGVTDDGERFAAFEFIDGSDLSGVLVEHHRLSPEIVAHILEQLLGALEEAHAHDLLHRDIKPANIRVFERDGDPWSVKLLDFGIARLSDGSHPSLTATGELIGTPRYMSPEQLLDLALEPRSDIYSLGIVAFEMLVGPDALHGGRWADQLERLRTGHLLSAPGFGDAAKLHAVIQRMTARDPERRYAAVGQVLADLRAATAVPKRPGLRNASTSSLLLGLAGLIAVIAILGVVAVTLTRDEAPPPATLPEAARQSAPFIKGNEPSRSPAVAELSAEDAGSDAGGVDLASVRRCSPPFVGEKIMESREGLDRWRAYIPRSYEARAPVPLLLLLHGDQQPAPVFLPLSGFESIADEHGFVIVAPDDGFIKPWRDVADIKRLKSIVTETQKQLCVDLHGVYVVGQGQGGLAAEKLSCEPWVRAIATNSHRPGEREHDCPRPVPFLMLSPLDSGHEPVEGGTSCTGQTKISLRENEQMWIARNSCDPKSKMTSFERLGGTCFSYSCEVPFQSCHLDGGHGWPGSERRPADFFQNCDGTPPQFPTAERIWRFFSSLEQ